MKLREKPLTAEYNRNIGNAAGLFLNANPLANNTRATSTTPVTISHMRALSINCTRTSWKVVNIKAETRADKAIPIPTKA